MFDTNDGEFISQTECGIISTNQQLVLQVQFTLNLNIGFVE